ncbi:chemotaxis protein [Vibrio sp. 10N.286.49.B3]|uniref:methyl-accepting chemotaxis protein n=1 Tax=Vibrio sp. 10N.286.49.B3 TaxID=1880855 RepID=UPI000C84F9DC|nr:methyl-accepting chemotaxis protein [Vibrio sp. 10N.286.49.B3]PMH46157.1 chemotaxis protein [Vibrio sp. 10N.286.49.B3]
MNLTHNEYRWLPWFGTTGKIAMRKACYLNRTRTQELEVSFQNIANTRVNLLQTWAKNQWSFLADAALYLSSKDSQERAQTLKQLLTRGQDFSELFVVDLEGNTLHSSHQIPPGDIQVSRLALEHGSQQPYLHGPYKDSRTLQLGASSSKFHDAVTLMFYQPFSDETGIQGCLCGRVPNDVISDIIQREAGHIYSESGDNYIFMIDSNHDTSIRSGTALSRSRFEDNTFSHGENLKEGINTDWGMVKVSQHTEFEVVFNDPATGQLHPGIRETIRNGENIFVSYPGYSDYRHIPVIGKGVTFQLPGSPDKWGMMCEADLEEVYRHRSLSYSLTKQFTIGGLFASLLPLSMSHFLGLNLIAQIGLTAFVLTIILFLLYRLVVRPLTQRIERMTQIMQTLTEGDGNLTQRIDADLLKADDIGGLGRWTNSFIDHLEGVISEIIFATNEVTQVSESMFRRTQQLSQASSITSSSIDDMLQLTKIQQSEITNANDSAITVESVMEKSVESAEQEFQQAADSALQIKSIVEASAQSVNEVNTDMNKITEVVTIITDITAQTNLLALNAAIEAARAGEHGRGFSVVADEVRTLANRTSEAANNIGIMMNQLHQQSQTAVNHMEQGIKNVESNAVMVNSVQRSAAMHQSVNELFTIINDLAKNSAEYGKTVDTAQESSEALALSSQQLSRRTTLMQNTLTRLEQLVNRFEVRNVA